MMIAAVCAVLAQSPPSEQCHRALFGLCGSTRADPEVCMRCISVNWNVTGACTFQEDERFCEVSPEEVACIDAMEIACGLPHPDPATCDSCVREHATAIRAANCTRSWESEYCHPAPPPPPPPSDECRRAQSAACRPTRNDPEACKACIRDNWNATGAAGCSIADDELFCQVTPAEVVCINALEKACGQGHPADAAACHKCIGNHATDIRAANCTDPWVEEYCAPKAAPTTRASEVVATTPTFTQTVYDTTDTCDKTAHKTVTKIALSTSTAQHCVEVNNWGKVIATCKSGTLTYTLFDNDNCTGHSAAGTRSWALGECVQGYGMSWMYTDCQETTPAAPTTRAKARSGETCVASGQECLICTTCPTCCSGTCSLGGICL